MAMTKAEKAALEAAQEDARIARALRWTEPAEGPDLAVPTEGSTSGWTFWPPMLINPATIYRAWSTAHAHGDGPAREPGRGGSQNGIPLYSTRVRALRALRACYERVSALALAELDEEIAKEGAK